jgi:hypothetical protein
MKRDLKWLLILASFIFLSTSIKVFAQTGVKTQLSISVAGIEYDDAAFTKLKLNIKGNKKAQDFKQSFSKNTATITLAYAGDATTLGMRSLPI